MDCVSWFKLQFPNILIHHSPNGGFRNAREAARFKKMGTLSGFPDIFIGYANSKFHGLFIEMKAYSNKLTKNQKDVFEYLLQQGYFCEVCYCLDDFIGAVNNYLKQ